MAFYLNVFKFKTCFAYVHKSTTGIERGFEESGARIASCGHLFFPTQGRCFAGLWCPECFSSGCGCGWGCPGASQGPPVRQRYLPTTHLRGWAWMTVLKTVWHTAGTCSPGEGQGKGREGKGLKIFSCHNNTFLQFFILKVGKVSCLHWPRRGLWEVPGKSFMKVSSQYIVKYLSKCVCGERWMAWGTQRQGESPHTQAALQSCWKAWDVLAGWALGQVLVGIALLTAGQGNPGRGWNSECLTVSTRQHQH